MGIFASTLPNTDKKENHRQKLNGQDMATSTSTRFSSDLLSDHEGSLHSEAEHYSEDVDNFVA